MALVLSSALLAASVNAVTISSFGPRTQAKSGLIRLIGEGFGDEAVGEISLNSQPVHVARWDDNVIEFYVPESAAVGSGKVILKTPTGRVGRAVSITERDLKPGRLQWRFQAADQYIITRPEVGPDGTVYVMGNYGHLYALSQDGGLKWLKRGSFGGVVDTLPDGTIVCGGGGGVQAFSPEGSPLWHFEIPTEILVGPSVGPDGNIYVVDNNRWGPNFLGAIVLDAQGQLVWHGGAFYNRGAFFSDEVQFDSQNAYWRSSGDGTSNSMPGLTAMRLGGGFRWQNPDTTGTQPGAVMSRGGVSAVGTSTMDRFRSDGTRAWSVSLYKFGGYQVSSDAVVGPDGSTYFLTRNNRLNAVSGPGEIKYSINLGTIPSQLAIRPDGWMLLMQTQSNSGQPVQVAAFSSSGKRLWQTANLPIEAGMAISIFNRIGFNADGTMAFFGTAGPVYANYVANCYVYGLRL
jgi:outer membrane protein assembly factor BamB